jgi:hypothetical protein
MLVRASGEGLTMLPMTDARFSRVIGIMTLRERSLPPLAQRFVELLREAAALGEFSA